MLAVLPIARLQPLCAYIFQLLFLVTLCWSIEEEQLQSADKAPPDSA